MPDLSNPVLRGSFPDPSLVRVGEWFYLATSSFQWFPSIPIHRSRDLRSWEYVGAVDSAVPGGSLAGVSDSGGIWAPALSHDGERFWITYAIVRSVGRPTFDLTVYVSTASEVAGPWSEPEAVASHGFDPSIYHEGGRHWLLNLQNDIRPEGERFAGIVVRELVAEQGEGGLEKIRATGPTSLLWQQAVLIEGPKVVHHDGWYYLVLAEGGTGYEHGVRVARSRELTGGYEIDPEPMVTTRRDPDSPLQKAGHAELVECADGRWVASLLAARPVQTPAGPRSVLGRETVIEAIDWQDGWPRLRHGGTRPRVTIPEADLPTADSSPPGGSRHALPANLGTGWPWSSLRAPVGSWARMGGDGDLLLTGRREIESLTDVALLAARVPEHRARVVVTVDADPTTFSQSAGLSVMYQSDANYTLHVTWAEPVGQAQRGQQWGAETAAGAKRGRRVVALVERLPHGRRTVAVTEVADAGPVRLGVEIEPHQIAFLVNEVVVASGLDVTELSDDAGDLRFTGLMVGMSCHDAVDAEFEARFSDWSSQATAIDPWEVDAELASTS